MRSEDERLRATTRRELLANAGAAGMALAGLPLLAACGDSGGNDKATVEFWDMPWGTAGYQETARAQVVEFNRTHPRITVNYRLVPWDNFYEVFSTAIASGRTPDVSTGATYQAFEYESAIAPVDDVIEKWKADGTAKDVIPASIAAQVDAKGKQTGLPWCLSTRVIAYNTKLFEAAGVKPPGTFEELRGAAKALTGDGVSGFGFVGQVDGGQMLTTLFLNNGGGLYDAACKPNLANDRNREVCQLLQDMVRDGSIPDVAAGWTPTDATDAYQRDELAMLIGEPAIWNSLSNGDVTDVLPPLEGFHGDKGSILWYTAIWLYESSKNKPAAIEFMNWWLANETEMWAKGGITALPVRKSFYDATKVLQDPRIDRVLDEYVPVGKILSAPCAHALGTLNKVEGQDFLNVLAQDVLTLKPIDASLAKAQTALAELETGA